MAYGKFKKATKRRLANPKYRRTESRLWRAGRSGMARLSGSALGFIAGGFGGASAGYAYGKKLDKWARPKLGMYKFKKRVGTGFRPAGYLWGKAKYSRGIGSNRPGHTVGSNPPPKTGKGWPMARPQKKYGKRAHPGKWRRI